MRKFRIFLLSICVILLVFLASVAVLIYTIDEDLLARTLTRVTDYRIEIDGPLSLDISMDPSLSVSGIKVEPRKNDEHLFSAHIGHIRTKIALKPLLSGVVLIKELFVKDAVVSYVDNGGPRPDQSEKVKLREKIADIDLPILESVTLTNINVTYLDKESDYSMQVLLHNCIIDDVRDTGLLYIKGAGTVENTDFSIDGQLGSVSNALRHIRPYPVDLSLNVDDHAFRISGTIDDPVEGKGLNMHITVEEAELSNISNVLKVDVPRLGHLDLNARVIGDIDAPGISDFRMEISGEPNFEFSAKGEVANLLTGEGTDITISASTSDRELTTLLLPEDLHSINKVIFTGKLRNIEGDYLVENLSLSLEKGKEATITASGNIVIGETPFDPEKLKSDLRLNMEAKNTQLLKSILFDWLPDTGPLSGKAQLSGPLMKPELKDIHITAGEPESVWIDAQGRVGSIPLDPDLPVSGIDLSLSVAADRAPQLFANVGIELPEIDDVSAEFRVHGSGDRLTIDGITVQMTDPDGVAANVSGRYILEKQETGEYLGTYDLDMNMNAPSLSTFQRLLAARALPDLKPAKASLRLSGTTEVMSLEDIVIRAGHPGPLHFECRGRIGKVTFDSDKPASEVEIINSFYAEKTSLLSPYAGISIPDFGPIEGSSRVVGRKEGYGFDDIEFVIGGKENVLMRAEGSVEYVMRGTDVAFDGIDVSFQLHDLDSRIIAEHLENDLLDIGKINGRLSVSGSPEDLSLSDIELLSLSPKGLKTSIHGGVQHIRPEEDMPLQGINIELTASTPDMSAVEKITEMDLPDLGHLNINARINDRDGDLNVETFLLRTGPEKMPTFLIEGSINDILSTEKMDVSVSFESATKPWAEELYGHKVPEDHRVKGKATLTGSRDNLHIDGTAHSGKTEVNAKIDLSRVNEGQRISVNISAPKIYLDDLGIYPEEREREKTAKKDKKIHREKIFSDEPYPFPELKDLDLIFHLEIEEVIGRGFTFNDFDIDVVLKDGLMLIGPARVTYADGFVSLQSTLDMRGSKPEMKLDLKAEDIDTADLFSYAHSPMILGGHLNLSIDLQSSGGSPREVASALNGKMGIAIEHGKIKQLADLLGADAIDFVTTARKLGTYQKLNCLALNFEFDDGIGNSQVIYIDTPSVRSQGKGTVNLRDETIDIVIQPKPKIKRLGGSSAVTIKGPLDKPSAK